MKRENKNIEIQLTGSDIAMNRWTFATATVPQRAASNGAAAHCHQPA